MDIYFCKTKLFGKQIEGANSDLITDAKVLLKNFPIKQKKDHFFAQNINQRDMLIFQHIFFLFPLFKILNTSFPLKFFKSENGKFHSNHNKAFCWEKKKGKSIVKKNEILISLHTLLDNRQQLHKAKPIVRMTKLIKSLQHSYNSENKRNSAQREPKIVSSQMPHLQKKTQKISRAFSQFEKVKGTLETNLKEQKFASSQMPHQR